MTSRSDWSCLYKDQQNKNNELNYSLLVTEELDIEKVD